MHEDTAVFLFPEKAPKPEKLVAPNAGYNFGLAGLCLPLDAEPGQRISLPLLLIWIDQPERAPVISLATVLESIRGGRPTAGQ